MIKTKPSLPVRSGRWSASHYHSLLMFQHVFDSDRALRRLWTIRI